MLTLEYHQLQKLLSVEFHRDHYLVLYYFIYIHGLYLFAKLQSTMNYHIYVYVSKWINYRLVFKDSLRYITQTQNRQFDC